MCAIPFSFSGRRIFKSIINIKRSGCQIASLSASVFVAKPRMIRVFRTLSKKSPWEIHPIFHRPPEHFICLQLSELSSQKSIKRFSHHHLNSDEPNCLSDSKKPLEKSHRFQPFSRSNFLAFRSAVLNHEPVLALKLLESIINVEDDGSGKRQRAWSRLTKPDFVRLLFLIGSSPTEWTMLKHRDPKVLHMDPSRDNWRAEAYVVVYQSWERVASETGVDGPTNEDLNTVVGGLSRLSPNSFSIVCRNGIRISEFVERLLEQLMQSHGSMNRSTIRTVASQLAQIGRLTKALDVLELYPRTNVAEPLHLHIFTGIFARCGTKFWNCLRSGNAPELNESTEGSLRCLTIMRSCASAVKPSTSIYGSLLTQAVEWIRCEGRRESNTRRENMRHAESYLQSLVKMIKEDGMYDDLSEKVEVGHRLLSAIDIESDEAEFKWLSRDEVSEVCSHVLEIPLSSVNSSKLWESCDLVVSKLLGNEGAMIASKYYISLSRAFANEKFKRTEIVPLISIFQSSNMLSANLWCKLLESILIVDVDMAMHVYKLPQPRYIVSDVAVSAKFSSNRSLFEQLIRSLCHELSGAFATEGIPVPRSNTLAVARRREIRIKALLEYISQTVSDLERLGAEEQLNLSRWRRQNDALSAETWSLLFDTYLHLSLRWHDHEGNNMKQALRLWNIVVPPQRDSSTKLEHFGEAQLHKLLIALAKGGNFESFVHVYETSLERFVGLIPMRETYRSIFGTRTRKVDSAKSIEIENHSTKADSALSWHHWPPEFLRRCLNEFTKLHKIDPMITHEDAIKMHHQVLILAMESFESLGSASGAWEAYEFQRSVVVSFPNVKLKILERAQYGRLVSLLCRAGMLSEAEEAFQDFEKTRSVEQEVHDWGMIEALLYQAAKGGHDTELARFIQRMKHSHNDLLTHCVNASGRPRYVEEFDRIWNTLKKSLQGAMENCRFDNAMTLLKCGVDFAKSESHSKGFSGDGELVNAIDDREKRRKEQLKELCFNLLKAVSTCGDLQKSLEIVLMVCDLEGTENLAFDTTEYTMMVKSFEVVIMAYVKAGHTEEMADLLIAALREHSLRSKGVSKVKGPSKKFLSVEVGRWKNSKPQRKWIPVTNTVANWIILNLVRQGDFDGGLRIVDEMLKSDNRPDIVSYTSLVSGVRSRTEIDIVCDSLQRAQKSFSKKSQKQSVQAKSVQTDERWWETLIAAFVEVGDLIGAESAFSDMVGQAAAGRSKLSPTVSIYNTLIHGWVKAGEYGRALSWYARLQSVSKKQISSATTSLVSPDVVTFNILIDASIRLRLASEPSWSPSDFFRIPGMLKPCEKDRQSLQTSPILQELEHSGISPSLATYNSLLRADSLDSHLDCNPQSISRSKWIKRIQEYGFVPDDYTFGALVGSPSDFERWQVWEESPINANDEARAKIFTERLSRIRRSLEVLVSLKMRPGIYAHNLVLSWLAAIPDPEGILTYIKEQMYCAPTGPVQCVPDAISWRHLVNAYLRQSKFEEAESIARWIPEALNAIRKAGLSEGDQLPEHLLAKVFPDGTGSNINQNDFQPDIESWNAVLNARVENGMDARALSILDDNWVPAPLVDHITTGTIMKLCVKRLQRNHADMIWEWGWTGKLFPPSVAGELAGLVSRPRSRILERKGLTQSAVCLYLDLLGYQKDVDALHDCWEALCIAGEPTITSRLLPEHPQKLTRKSQYKAEKSCQSTVVAKDINMGEVKRNGRYCDLPRQPGWPTNNMFNSYIEALHRCGKPSEAVSVFMKMGTQRSLPRSDKSGGLKVAESFIWTRPTAKSLETALTPLIYGFRHASGPQKGAYVALVKELKDVVSSKWPKLLDRLEQAEADDQM
ncbi:hypothetical protein BJ742DRAFT_817718 [Cladochytrium replicatum]|nr:hypothetical protein BJ742DRAFT_817718 [Cladochytrium replicatum]